MAIKLGEHIKRVLDARKMKLKDFAEDLGMVRQNVYRIFEKDSIETELLVRISTVLNHNFFLYFDHPLEGVGREVTMDASTRSAAAEERLASCENELRLAKKEIDYLKRIIDLMEERTRLLSSQQHPVHN